VGAAAGFAAVGGDTSERKAAAMPRRLSVRPLRASCEPPHLLACCFVLAREKAKCADRRISLCNDPFGCKKQGIIVIENYRLRVLYIT